MNLAHVKNRPDRTKPEKKKNQIQKTDKQYGLDLEKGSINTRCAKGKQIFYSQIRTKKKLKKQPIMPQPKAADQLTHPPFIKTIIVYFLISYLRTSKPHHMHVISS